MERIVLSKSITRALVYGVIGVMAFVLFTFFSQPNRLAHDQIDHALVHITRDNPAVFEGDYIWGTPKRSLLDNHYSLKLIELIESEVGGGQTSDGTPVGSREVTRWLLLPFIFFLATVGMYELCFAITRNSLVSFGAALISNIHVPYVFVTEWGLPGPTELDPWVFVAALYPFVLLLFYKGIKQSNGWLIALSFLLIGIIGNLHLISWFNIVGALATFYLLYYRFSMKHVLRLFAFGLLTIAGVFPFLIRYFSSRPPIISTFDSSDPTIWNAIREIALHVTAAGKVVMLRQWLFDYWWFIWPAIVVFGFAWWLTRKNRFGESGGETKVFLKFGALVVFATLAFNAAFSVFNLVKLYYLHELPEFNEPRGIQLMYPVFFVALAIVSDYVMKWIKGILNTSSLSLRGIRSNTIVSRMHQRLLQSQSLLRNDRVVFFGFVIVFVITFGAGVIVFPKIKSFSYAQTRAPYTFDTCDSELYRELNHILKPNDLILVDPTYYGAIRVCTKHSIVVHNRDKATAYVHGSDTMMEWFSRFHEVQNAFETGGDTLLATAKNYGAEVIVSRQCIPVDESQLSYSKKILHPTLEFEGCVYRVR